MKKVVSNSILEKLFFMAGLTAGMTCIGFYSDNGGVTLFTFVQFLLVLAGLFLKQPIIKEDRIKSAFFIFVVCIFVSTSVGAFRLPEIYQKKCISELISYAIGMTSFYLLYNEDDLREYGFHFIKGIKINFVVQIVWSIMQFITGNFMGFSLNYQVGLYMPKQLPITEVSGLTWERAELSLVLVVGYILFRENTILRFLALVCLIMTGSRTALIMSVVLVVFSIDFKRLFQNKNGKGINITNSMILLVVVVVISLFWNNLYEVFDATYTSLINYRYNASGMGHLNLYKYFPVIIENLSLVDWLIGFGSGCSGLPYSLYAGRNVGLVWSVESTILAFFFSYGIVGFSAWLVWMFNCSRKCKKNGKKEIAKLYYIVLIGSVFYALLSNWGLTVLIVLADAQLNINTNTDGGLRNKNEKCYQ